MSDEKSWPRFTVSYCGELINDLMGGRNADNLGSPLADKGLVGGCDN
jgi:hypothetical protein